MIIQDEELRTIYKISGEERLEKLAAGLLQLELHPDDATTLKELRREVHNLKGDSKSLGLEAISVLAEHTETILEHIQHREIGLTFGVSDRLQQGLRAIEQLLHEAVTGEPSGVDVEQVCTELREAIASSKSAIDSLPLQPGTTPAPARVLAPESPVPSAALLLDEDEELREIYKTTTEDRLHQLATGLQQLAQCPDDATVDRLRRQIHSLKGDSRSVGLDTVATLAQHVEAIVKRLQPQTALFTPEVSDCLYQGLDAIAQLVQEAVTGIPAGVTVEQVSHRLIAVFKSLPQEGDPSAIACQTPFSDPVAFDPAASDPPWVSVPVFLTQTTGFPPESTALIEDAELREIYGITSRERLQRLEAGLVHLERQPADTKTLTEMLREAHSFKGDSRSAGVESVETLIHQVEEVLGWIQRRELELTGEVSDRLFQSLDAMQQLAHKAVTGEPHQVDITQVLHQLLKTIPATVPAQDAVDVPLSLPQIAPDPNSALRIEEPYQIDTIRVQTRELDALMAHSEALTITKIQISQATEQVERLTALWQEWKANQRYGQSLHSDSFAPALYEDRLEQLINDLKWSAQDNSAQLSRIAEGLGDKIRSLRLLPLSTVFQLFPRMVRDLARQQNKAVELILEGGETTADKQVLEGMKDALLHLIRNALDHGIEPPAEREQLGKPAAAKIWLRGYQTTNSIVVEVADDGRGLNIGQIKQTAIARKLYRPEDLERMTANQIHALIMESGFSTRTLITELSGRGVGLDVVRTTVERLKGTIQIDSTPNQGSTFRLELKTALATANVVLVDIQGIIHALPFDFLQTTLVISPDQIVTTDGRETITLDDRPIPVANLIDILELTRSPAYAFASRLQQTRGERLSCVILNVGGEQAGFFVDRLLNAQEVVIKPQSRILRRVRNVLGATTLASGEVCMILNPPDLLNSLQRRTSSAVPAIAKGTVQRKAVILLVEDSLPVRTQEKRLFENAGYEVVVAVDGSDGYNKLKTQAFDAVVSDVEMPNLDGLSLTAQIRQHPEYAELPIILVTTLSSDEDRKRGAEAGANAYIVKGKFNQEALLETLARLI
ncbi:MAG: response regulator [Leptolyngbyaceae cyanobacterium RU_5_1]|nr:response regulator [Leptolyngbyaceae cyanobacterium RU_5_1]